jgi:hypothetical protein
MRDIKNYNDVFNSKNAFILLDHKEKNHNIDLLLSKELLYESLYFFFKKELSILQKYLSKNLTLDKIREFISLVDASMLFVLKNNNNLRLCVNYRNLNVITIKNKCFLSLIKKTLNCLVDVVYFPKLNLKNAYYWIRIR